MKLSQSQITRFNHRDTLVVISAYPLKNTTHTGGGLASYTKNTLLGIKKAHPHQKIVVIADAKEGPEIYLEKDILIVRVWRRNHPFLFPKIQGVLNQLPRAKNLLFEFEFAAYGDLFLTGLLPLFLGSLKLQGYQLSLVVHQVVRSLADLSLHTGLKDRLPLYNRLLKAYYTTLAHLSDHVITLEAPLAHAFNQITHTKKAISLPHGFVIQKPLAQKLAQQKLNLPKDNYYVLAFGYLSHYKGSDLLVKAFQKPLTINGHPVKLILAGGESPTQGQKPHYQSYYKNLYQDIDSNPSIIHTGFVPDTRIKAYYSAVDLCIFPYRTFMAASGPLSFALAYRRPFIVSRHLALYSDRQFDLSTKSIRASIKKAIKLKVKPKLNQNRLFTNQANSYLNLALSPNRV